MSTLISFLDYVTVSIFGMVLSFAFSDTLSSRKGRLMSLVGGLVLLLAQGAAFYLWGAPILENIYPLVVHVPLILLLWVISRQLLWSGISVLLAYLCCQLRFWFGLLGAFVLGGDDLTLSEAKMIVTLPVLLLLLRFIVPAVHPFCEKLPTAQLRIGLIPAIYYAFDYSVTVYTDLLYQGIPAVIEFMPFVCCVAYLLFLLSASTQELRRMEMEQLRNSLSIQVTQATREITALRESQKQTDAYRHDLRHHLQFLSECLENGQVAQAQEYIRSINEAIEAQKVTRYCENETVNLILSAFGRRCAASGVRFDVHAVLPHFLIISDSDLCVILSNVLENALYTCEKQPDGSFIEVSAREKGGKFVLQVVNSCHSSVAFRDGLPVTDSPGHGIGVKSVCAAADRYRGLYSFSQQGDRFIFRLSI